MYSDIIIFRRIQPSSAGSEYLISCGYKVFSVKTRFKWLYLFLRVFHKFKPYSAFLAKLFWKIDVKLLSKATMIIVFDAGIDYYFCSFIQRYFSNKKLILNYWNKIDTVKEREINHYKPFWDIFSFDINDCRKYQLKYNKMFISMPNNFSDLIKLKIQQDVFFVGKNKGRADKIMKIKYEFDKLGITYKIICTGADKYSNQGIQTKRIPYNEVLIENMKSRAILDINYNDMYGQTLREIESLSLNRKLITDNIFVKERDYYNPDNVYIIDYSRPDFLEGIKDFLEKPCVPIDENILKSYSVESWIQRFTEQNK